MMFQTRGPNLTELHARYRMLQEERATQEHLSQVWRDDTWKLPWDPTLLLQKRANELLTHAEQRRHRKQMREGNIIV